MCREIKVGDLGDGIYDLLGGSDSADGWYTAQEEQPIRKRRKRRRRKAQEGAPIVRPASAPALRGGLLSNRSA